MKLSPDELRLCIRALRAHRSAMILEHAEFGNLTTADFLEVEELETLSHRMNKKLNKLLRPPQGKEPR